MPSYLWFALGAVAAVLVLRRLQSSSTSSADLGPQVPPTPDGVKQLLAEGHPVRAMKLAHQITGNDPVKAQALFDALGLKVQISVSGHITTMGHTETRTLSPAETQEIRTLLLSDNKIEAIKKMQELAGLDLTTAKRAVEVLESTPPG